MKKCLPYLCMAAILCLYACSKNSGSNNSNNNPPVTLKITGINPDSGGMGTPVTITGTGFNPTGSSDMITFNGVTAAVTSASSTQLIVQVPAGAGSGDVKVTVNGTTTTGPQFNYIVSGQVTTLAGNGLVGYVDGAAAMAEFSSLWGIAIDQQGNIYVSDPGNYRIRKLTPAGMVSTLAGNGTAGYTDGNGSAANFNTADGITIDPGGNIYVADLGNSVIRKISPAGLVSTLAGTGSPGYVDGAAATAQFKNPFAVASDAQGNIFVADGNNRVRKIAAGSVTTLAGNGTGGYMDGPGNMAEFNSITGIAVDTQGNVYVVENGNSRVRKITAAGIVSTLAGNGLSGSTDGQSISAEFDNPLGLAIDSHGNLYVGDHGNYKIRKISPGGMVTTIAGTTMGFLDGSLSNAEFGGPIGVTVDPQGNIYVADAFPNQRIRKISIQ